MHLRREQQMTTLTQSLREEHKELMPHIEAVRTVADSVGEAPTSPLCQGIDEVYEFLTHHLIPHAQAEERALYPVVGKVMGTPEATATMSRDHVEIGQFTEELAALRSNLSGETISAPQAKALRRVLYGLYALVKVHFAKEEEVYLPLLDARLSSEEARSMFEAMERAAHEVKSRLR
jgi:iron-sulfur cluster repair protein YtfE (RIC family)